MRGSSLSWPPLRLARVFSPWHSHSSVDFPYSGDRNDGRVWTVDWATHQCDPRRTCLSVTRLPDALVARGRDELRVKFELFPCRRVLRDRKNYRYDVVVDEPDGALWPLVLMCRPRVPVTVAGTGSFRKAAPI